MSVQSTTLFKKICGCLMGGLAGDAMGGPTEGMHFKDIQEKFGEITHFMEYRGRPAGCATDDSALKRMLCKAIIRKQGKPTCEDWAEVWREDMKPCGFIAQVRNSWRKIFVMGVPPREAGLGNGVTNSSSMCISPIGIINAGNPRQAALDAYYLGQMIHWGYILDGPSAAAAATAEAFNPEATIDSVVEASTANIPKNGDMVENINYAMDLAKKAQSYTVFRDLYYEGLEAEPGSPIVDPRPVQPSAQRLKSKRNNCDPRESVSVALAVFWLAEGDPVKTIIDCANFGRDSDTIGTIAGAIAGAFRGIDAFPPDWIETVRKGNEIDFLGQRQPDQMDLSHQLYDVVIKLMNESESRLENLKQQMRGRKKA